MIILQTEVNYTRLGRRIREMRLEKEIKQQDIIYGQKSPYPPSGQVATYTELTVRNNNKIIASDALIMHCYTVRDGRIFLCISGYVPRCRSPPVNLDFSEIQIDWRYITWMLTRKRYGSAVKLSK